MANRSDFYTAKIPRQIKRMITLDGTIDSHVHRQLWVKAHESAKRAKMRQNTMPGTNRPTEAVSDSAEVAE